jgi:hypothetical protein
MKPISSTMSVGEIADLSDLDDGRVVDLGSGMPAGFAQVSVVSDAVAPTTPPETMAAERHGIDVADQSNSQLQRLLKDVQRGHAEDLLSEDEIGDGELGAPPRVVEVEVFDLDGDPRMPIARFTTSAADLDDKKVREMAETVEETQFNNARWVVGEMWARWKNGERKIVLLAKKL